MHRCQIHLTHTFIHPRAFIALWIFSLTLHSKAWHDFKLRKPEFTQIQPNEALNVFVNCKNAFLVLFISQKQSAMKVRSFFWQFLIRNHKHNYQVIKIVLPSIRIKWNKKECFVAFHSNFVPKKREKNKKIKFSGCSFFLKVSSESIKHSKKLLEA